MGVFSDINFDLQLLHSQTGSGTMREAAGIPLLTGSYSTLCKQFPLISLCSCAAPLALQTQSEK